MVASSIMTVSIQWALAIEEGGLRPPIVRVNPTSTSIVINYSANEAPEGPRHLCGMSHVLRMIAEGEHQQQDFKTRIDDSRPNCADAGRLCRSRMGGDSTSG